MLCNCGILVPPPGVEPGRGQWKRWVLTTGPPGNSHKVRVLEGAKTSSRLFPITFRIKVTLLGWNTGSSTSCLPISSLISWHSHQSFEQALNYLALCLCPYCSLCLDALFLTSCASCCLYLKTQLTHHFSDLDTSSLCSLNSIVNRRRPGVWILALLLANMYDLGHFT